MNFLKYIPDFEKQLGHKASPAVIRFAKGLEAVGKMFEQKGQEDAAAGKSVPTTEIFTAWGQTVSHNDRELGDYIGTLMQMAYMDGYDANRIV